MSLPTPPALETEKFELFGEPFQIHALTRAQALDLNGAELDITVAETKLIAAATDTPYDEVVEWLATVPAGSVQPLVLRITELSGLVVTGPFRTE